MIPDSRVTVLAYHFWESEKYVQEFDRIARSFLETWKHCGNLKSVLVVNKIERCIEDFAAQHAHLSIQCESRLIPGNIFSLSNDCNSRLYTRFDTPYVMTIQNDGWPLRSGLEEFVGEWDFIGAPHIRDRWYLRVASSLMKFHPMNGGFSLRSHECCEQVAFWWNGKYKSIGDCLSASEDIFTTQFLPKNEPAFKRVMRFPNVSTALSFSYQKIEPYQRQKLPFGFHNLESLVELRRRGLINCETIISFGGSINEV